MKDANCCVKLCLLLQLCSTDSVCLPLQSSGYNFFSFNLEHVYVDLKTLDLYSTRQDATILLEQEESHTYQPHGIGI